MTVHSITHEVYGEFSIIFDDDMPLADLDTLNILVQGHWIRVNQDNINLSEVLDYIQDNGDVSEWYADNESLLIDYTYGWIRDEGGR